MYVLSRRSVKVWGASHRIGLFALPTAQGYHITIENYKEYKSFFKQDENGLIIHAPHDNLY